MTDDIFQPCGIASHGLTHLHVIPIGDLREHVERVDCWCAPTPDDDEPRVLVHHAADMREHYEVGNSSRERPRA